MNEETIFTGSGKEISSNLVSLNVCVSDIPKEWIKEAKNGKSYVRLDLVRKRQVDDWGNTHFLKVNQWTPELTGKKEEPEEETVTVDALPF